MLRAFFHAREERSKSAAGSSWTSVQGQSRCGTNEAWRKYTTAVAKCGVKLPPGRYAENEAEQRTRATVPPTAASQQPDASPKATSGKASGAPGPDRPTDQNSAKAEEHHLFPALPDPGPPQPPQHLNKKWPSPMSQAAQQEMPEQLPLGVDIDTNTQ